MTVRHIMLFLEVYRTRNITRAAENLHMTQPTVTRAIQELEQHYHVKLFDRVNHRLSVTAAGEQLYLHAAKTMDAYTQMEEQMENLDGSGTVRVGASLTIGSVLLPGFISRFQADHPNVRVRSLICNTAELKRALEENEIDFALAEGGIQGDQLYKEPFAQDNLVLLLPPDSPLRNRPTLTLEDLKDARFLLRERGSVGRSYVDHVFSSHGLPLEPVMESASTHALVQAVHAGLGIAILPEALVRHSIDSGFVATHSLKGVSLHRTHYIVWHKGKFLSDSALAMMKLCRHLGSEQPQ